MRAHLPLLLLPLLLAPGAHAGFLFQFDEKRSHWSLSNGPLTAELQLTDTGTLEFRSLALSPAGDIWTASPLYPTSPIRFNLGTRVVDANTPYKLVSQFSQAIPRDGYRQTIVLQDMAGAFEATLDLEMYANQPVLRQSVRIRNLQAGQFFVRHADMLPYRFSEDGQTFQVFRVNQWSVITDDNFETLQASLRPTSQPVNIRSGSRGAQCTWVAIKDDGNRGLFAGWEFDGRSDGSVRNFADQDYLQLSATVVNLFHPVPPGAEFQIPAAFLGLFHGDWDEAGYRTQRFVEAAIAQPRPDSLFPYVVWDSWGYEEDIDQQTLRRNAEIAAKLGIELFVLDLGWARQIGDWRANPGKFPSGLKALSDYVHQLGMKFGVHFALTEADEDSPILAANPDWTSSVTYGYHGAVSLCLAHKPVRDWLVAEGVRMIDEYGVDWFLQDGENMVKECTKSTHTHHRRDSNYAGSVEGLNAVVSEIQRLRPNTLWENCEDGGTMMTYNMVRNYVTSITNDANGALGSREAVYGATYPLPPRYADRYMIEDTLTPYITRSYVFGGPWIFMNRLPEVDAEQLEFAAREVAMFKEMRRIVVDGKVSRSVTKPGENRIDAIMAYNEAMDTAVGVVSRNGGTRANYPLRFMSVIPDRTYRVRFRDDTRVLVMTGTQLIRDGVPVRLPATQYGEVVFVEPQ